MAAEAKRFQKYPGKRKVSWLFTLFVDAFMKKRLMTVNFVYFSTYCMVHFSQQWPFYCSCKHLISMCTGLGKSVRPNHTREVIATCRPHCTCTVAHRCPLYIWSTAACIWYFCKDHLLQINCFCKNFSPSSA